MSPEDNLNGTTQPQQSQPQNQANTIPPSPSVSASGPLQPPVLPTQNISSQPQVVQSPVGQEPNFGATPADIGVPTGPPQEASPPTFESASQLQPQAQRPSLIKRVLIMLLVLIVIAGVAVAAYMLIPTLHK